jgi:hypothetical protein
VSQPALRVELPAIQPDVERAITRYVGATFHSFERALVGTVATLREPRVADPERASRRLGFLVETLSGIALGLAVGQLGQAVRRGLGAAACDAVTEQLARVARGGTRPSGVVIGRLDGVPRFLVDAHARPLLDELGGHLQARLCGSVEDARALVSSIHGTLLRVAPDRLGAFASLLALLARDDAAAIVFDDHLKAAWDHFCAMVTGKRPAELPEVPRWRSVRATWMAWSRRAANTVPTVTTPTLEQVVEAGYVLRIG